MNRKTRVFSLAIMIVFLVGLISLAAVRVERGDRTFIDQVTFAKVPKSSVGNGAHYSGFPAVEYGEGIVHKSVINIPNSITITDDPGTGAYGGIKCYEFPEGMIMVLGVVPDLTASSASGTDHGIAAAADGDFSIGTVGCNSGSLTSTEANIIASTAIAQFATTAGVIKGANAAAVLVDGHTTEPGLYLNVIFDDADCSANDVLTIGGSLTVYWINLGDY